MLLCEICVGLQRFLVTFRVSSRRREMYSGHARLSVFLSVRGAP